MIACLRSTAAATATAEAAAAAAKDDSSIAEWQRFGFWSQRWGKSRSKQLVFIGSS